MSLDEQIQEAYKTSASYPEAVKKLIAIGVQSYSVEVTTGIMLYRFNNGENVVHQQTTVARQVSGNFNHEATVQAVRNTQQGKTDYTAFMNEIAKAGIRFYEATFTGNKRVTYLGIGGMYEEAIPFL